VRSTAVAIQQLLSCPTTATTPMTLSGTSSLDCQVHVRNVKYTMFVTHTVLVASGRAVSFPVVREHTHQLHAQRRVVFT
jgi:hypothetical protein